MFQICLNTTKENNQHIKKKYEQTSQSYIHNNLPMINENTNSLDSSLPNLILSKISTCAKKINCYSNNSFFELNKKNENNKIYNDHFSCPTKNYYCSLIKIKSNNFHPFKNVCSQNCSKKICCNIYNLIKIKSIKSKLFKLDKNKINCFKKKREKIKKLYFYKKNKLIQHEKKHSNYFSCTNLKKTSSTKYYFPLDDKNDKNDRIKYNDHFQLFEYNKSEEIDKKKYIKSISLSIKKQKKKVYLLEKNACRLLDIIELLLYTRMDEIFTLKQNLSNHDKYKEMYPDVFYFDNNDDLIEVLDKKLKFLPKIPAIKNLVPYFGPTPESIFGKYYSSYKYYYKLIDIKFKIYKVPNLFIHPICCGESISFNSYEQNSQNYENDLQKYEQNGQNYDHFFTQNNFRKARKTNSIMASCKIPFLNFIPNSNKNIIQNNQTDLIKIDKIPSDLIQILNYKIRKLAKKRESTIFPIMS